VTFQLRFTTAGPLDRPVLGFGIYREDGLYVAQISTETSGHHTGVCHGQTVARFQWDCPFASGGYRVSALIHDPSGQILLAQAHSAAGFEILPRPGFDSAVVRVEGRWEVGCGGNVTGLPPPRLKSLLSRRRSREERPGEAVPGSLQFTRASPPPATPYTAGAVTARFG
jgi:hypothetical protein